MKLTYIRWAMTLIETLGATIVTDPVFRLLGIQQTPKAYTFERMPRPDLVFISHTHLDHYAPSVLRRLPPGTPIWMPVEKADRASRLGLAGLRGVEAWESDEFHGLRLTAVPAKHAGGELGLVIEGDRTAYFAGDTSLDVNLFHAIAERWRLDAVLLPIGRLKTLGIPFRHIGPKQAPKALWALGEPPVVLPTHYSGMTLWPIMTFGGTPRKLSQAIRKAEMGTLVGTTRPLESIEI
jgi:L-ascorbate metabolism protein UlaG (beta-lactamase superfamily)